MRTTSSAEPEKHPRNRAVRATGHSEVQGPDRRSSTRIRGFIICDPRIKPRAFAQNTPTDLRTNLELVGERVFKRGVPGGGWSSLSAVEFLLARKIARATLKTSSRSSRKKAFPATGTHHRSVVQVDKSGSRALVAGSFFQSADSPFSVSRLQKKRNGNLESGKARKEICRGRELQVTGGGGVGGGKRGSASEDEMRSLRSLALRAAHRRRFVDATAPEFPARAGRGTTTTRRSEREPMPRGGGKIRLIRSIRMPRSNLLFMARTDDGIVRF